ASGTNSFYLVTQGSTLDLRVRITSSQGDVSLNGYGIMYNLSSTGITRSAQSNREVRYFNGTNTTPNFTLSFLPDPALLKVYDVFSGQVYVNGVFDVDGYTVKFASDQFSSS